MAKKASQQPSSVPTGEAPGQGGRAPERADGADDLAQVEAAIDDAQRAAQSLGDEVDGDAAESIAEGAAAAAQRADHEAPGAMDDIVSALEEVEQAQASAGQAASLRDYDEAIAGAVDDLLEGDFVSVDLVLEGMNESMPPPLSPEAKDAAGETATPEPASDVKVDLETGHTSKAARASAKPTAITQGPATSGSETGSATNDDKRTEEVQAEDEARSPAETSEATERATAAERPVRKPAPPRAREDEPVSAAASRTGTPGAALQVVRELVMPAVRMGVMPMLELLSFPLRLIPPKARDIVDWLALSLIFWVPIVWIFALFIVG